MRRSELRVSQDEAIAGLLNLFVYAEQHWCEWPNLEDNIAEVDYNNLPNEELEWFIEFLANICLRVWRSIPDKAKKPMNKVEDGGEGFLIFNYDWKAFKFAKQKGADNDLTTRDLVCVMHKNLNEEEMRWLRSKVK